MSDVFWMGFFGLCTAGLAACLAYVFNERTATRQTARSERQSAQEWARSESRRKAEEARDEAHRQEDYQRSDARYRQELARQEVQRREELQALRLREFWEYVLQTNHLLSKLEDRKRRHEPVPFDQELPSNAVAKACAVALLGLDALYLPAKKLGQATVKVEVLLSRIEPGQSKIDPEDSQQMLGAMHGWKNAFIALEKEVAKMTGISIRE